MEMLRLVARGDGGRTEEAGHGVLVGDDEVLEAEAHEARAASGSGRQWSFGGNNVDATATATSL